MLLTVCKNMPPAECHKLFLVERIGSVWTTFVHQIVSGLLESCCTPGKCSGMRYAMFKGSLGGETSVLRTFRMSGKESVKERVSEGKS